MSRRNARSSPDPRPSPSTHLDARGPRSLRVRGLRPRPSRHIATAPHLRGLRAVGFARDCAPRVLLPGAFPMHRPRAFTLIELLVVIAIIAARSPCSSPPSRPPARPPDAPSAPTTSSSSASPSTTTKEPGTPSRQGVSATRTCGRRWPRSCRTSKRPTCTTPSISRSRRRRTSCPTRPISPWNRPSSRSSSVRAMGRSAWTRRTGAGRTTCRIPAAARSTTAASTSSRGRRCRTVRSTTRARCVSPGSPTG